MDQTPLSHRFAPSHGDTFTVQPWAAESAPAWDGSASDPTAPAAGKRFVLEVKDEANSPLLMASLSMLDRLLLEKTAEVRQRHLAEMVDFMAERLLVPSAVELAMAQRLASRHARVLNDWGYYTAEQLADANGSQAANRSALADNWRKRRQVFAVPHPDRTARSRDVYPAFQFADQQPIKAVAGVLATFGPDKAPWALALWFTSANGWLPGNARPVDLLGSDPQAVLQAARQDTASPTAV